MGEIGANAETNRARRGYGCTLNSFLKGSGDEKTEYRERSPFKLAGIALAARMEAFADITGSGAG
jgi:hypothetical protein